MGILTYTSTEEGTDGIIVSEDIKTVEETPATPVVEEQPSEEE